MGEGQALETEVKIRVSCYASSFADPKDVQRYRECKAEGHSDDYCFRIGDNGVGCWDDDTSQGSGPACALPPEVLQVVFGSVDAGKHQQVTVYFSDKSVVCLIKDTMPHYQHLLNPARIDLNPDACAALGISIPAMSRVVYEAGCLTT